MNVGQYDYKALVKHIEACRNRDFSETAAGAISGFLGSLEWFDAKDLVEEFCRRSPIPANVLGALAEAWEERQRLKKAVEWRRPAAAAAEDGYEGEGPWHLRESTCEGCGAEVTTMFERAKSYPGRYWIFYSCKTGCLRNYGYLSKPGSKPPVPKAAAVEYLW